MSTLTKALIALLDEMVFRPLVWAVNWSPDLKRKYPNRLEDFWEDEDGD